MNITTIWKHISLTVVLLAASGKLAVADPIGTAFTYQGRLADSGGPASGLYDFQFVLCDAATNGAALGTNAVAAVPVTNGLYNVALDFGASAFDGNARWLVLSVRTNGSIIWTALTPRLALTPTPYAIRATTAGGVSGVIPDSQLSANIARLNGTNVFAGPVTAPSFSGSGSSLSGIAPASGSTNYVAKAGDTMTGSLNFGVASVLQEGGQIGVGTSNPGASIDVVGWVRVDGSGPPYPGRTGLELGVSRAYSEFPGYSWIQSHDYSLALNPLGNNVGIGTTSPQATLDVAGSVKASGAQLGLLQIPTAGADATNTLAIACQGTSNDNFLYAGQYLGHYAFGFHNFLDPSAPWAGINAYIAAYFGMDFFTAGVNRMRIGFNGNVGLGTQSPDTRLDMAGGTISMGPLDGAGEIRFRTGTANNASGGVGLTAIDHSGAFADGMAIYGHDGVSLWTAQTERMRIAASGNVGIGTDSPVAKLHITGGGLGLPATSGISQSPGHVARFRPGDNAILDMGGDSVSGFWFQSTDQTGLSANYPLLLNPNGGNVGIGTTSPQAKLHVNGDLIVNGTNTVKVLSITGGSDVAEPFPLAAQEIPRGSVVVIDDEHPGQLKLSTEPYDQRVAGIVSGANGINPGITLSQQGALEGGQNVALSGRVYVLADAVNAPIKPGDLLTTSTVPGHAMKVTDHAKAQGAILGKAMSRLPEGRGLVLVLVTLQ